MKKIPLAEALALLKQAVDVVVDEQSTTNLFHLGVEDEPFLTLETEEDHLEWHYSFEDEHNQEVEVDGEWMTLIASPDHPGNPEPVPVRMRLLRVMDLEGAVRWPLKVTKWISTGELENVGEIGDTNGILAQAGRILDSNCSGDMFDDVVFEAEDGKTYTGNVEFVLGECAPDYLADVLERKAEDRCDECEASLDDGEGYDGLCGNCADKALAREDAEAEQGKDEKRGLYPHLEDPAN